MIKNMEKEAEEHDTEAAAEKITAAATSPAVVTTTTVWAAASQWSRHGDRGRQQSNMVSGDGFDQFQWNFSGEFLLHSYQDC